VCEADGYDAARLLSAPEQARLSKLMGDGPYRVSLARRELVLVCRANDAQAVAQLESLTPASDGIGGRFALEGGRLVRVGAKA
jgi:hypothetical protein